MKKEIINFPKYKIELNQEEYNLIQNCLDYGWHRLSSHETTGLSKVVKDLTLVNKIRMDWRK